MTEPQPRLGGHAQTLLDLVPYAPRMERSADRDRLHEITDRPHPHSQFEILAIAHRYAAILPLDMLEDTEIVALWSLLLDLTRSPNTDDPNEPNDTIRAALTLLRRLGDSERLTALGLEWEGLAEAAPPELVREFGSLFDSLGARNISDTVSADPDDDQLVADTAKPSALGAPETPSTQSHLAPSDELGAPVDAPFDFIAGLEESRAEAARAILAGTAYARADKRDDNRAQLEALLQGLLPITAGAWDTVAFLAGAYARTPTPESLAPDERKSFVFALRWAVWYELEFRPQNGSTRFRDLVGFIGKLPEADEVLSDNLDELLAMARRAKPRAVRDFSDLLRASGVPPARKVPVLAELDLLVDGHAADTGPSTKHDEPKHDGLPAEPIVFMLRPPDPGSRADTLARIQRHFGLMSRKYQERLRPTLDAALLDSGGESGQAVELALINAICHSCIWRLTDSKAPSLSDADLDEAVLLAAAATQPIEPQNTAYDRALDYVLLAGTQALRTRTTGLDTYIDSIRALPTPVGPRRGGRHAADLCLATAAKHLASLRATGTAASDLPQRFLNSLAEKQPFGRDTAIQAFLDEVTQWDMGDSVALSTLRRRLDPQPTATQVTERTALDFLDSESDRTEFDELIRNGRLDDVYPILASHREGLLRLASEALVSETFLGETHLRSPRKWVPGMRNFRDAKAALASNDPAKRREGQAMFRQTSAGGRGPKPADRERVLEEWQAYADARVEGPVMAQQGWKTHRDQGVASLEELWNLAVTYTSLGFKPEALQTLQPGVTAKTSPLEHLRFALWLGIGVLAESPSTTTMGSEPSLVRFLVDHLRLYPLPECYLVWLLLQNEAGTPTSADEALVALASFMKMRRSPIDVPEVPTALSGSPKDRAARLTRFEAFRDELGFGLATTWKMWLITSMSEEPRFPAKYEWSTQVCAWLMETYDREGDRSSAEQTAETAVGWCVRWYRTQKDADRPVHRPLVQLRFFAERLFQYHATQEPNRAERDFRRYIEGVPELLDGSSKNTKLVALLNKLLQGWDAGVARDERPAAPSADLAWSALHVALAEVTTIAQLSALREQVEAKIDLDGLQRLTDRSARDATTSALTCLGALLTLSESTLTPGELSAEIDQLSEQVKTLLGQIGSSGPVAVLRPLVYAIQRALGEFAQSRSAFPVLELSVPREWQGLSVEATSSSLVVALTQPGPGVVTDIELVLEGADGKLRQTEVVVVPELKSTGGALVAVPVDYAPAQEPLPVSARARYRWGSVTGLESACVLEAPFFSFAEAIAANEVIGHEYSAPFKYGAPLDMSSGREARLFRGRTGELEEIRRTLLSGNPPSSPYYFYGIRRVGKTTLLNKVAVELRAGGMLPIYVNCLGIDAVTKSLEYNVLGLLGKIKAAVGRSYPDLPFSFELPQDHPHPELMLPEFFGALRQWGGAHAVIILLDEAQYLVSDSATLLLDRIKEAYDARDVLFILSGLQPPGTMMVQTRSQLTLDKHRVDFLDIGAVTDLLRSTLGEMGIAVPDASIRTMYRFTAGHPNFCSMLGNLAVHVLNREQRTMIVPSDIEEGAAVILRDPGVFDESWLSSKNLTDEERSAATHLAHAMERYDDGLELGDAVRLTSDLVLQNLEQKHIIQVRDGQRIAIKGRLLFEGLRTRITEKPIIDAELFQGPRNKVGIFVDLENCIGYKPADMTMETFFARLYRYGAQFGEPVTRVGVAADWNIWAMTRMSKEEIDGRAQLARFTMRWVDPALRFGATTKDLADSMLVAAVHDAELDTCPDVYVVFSGDKDYAPKIGTLLDRGHTIRVVAGAKSRAGFYGVLEERRERNRIANGWEASDFFTDELEPLFEDEGPDAS